MDADWPVLVLVQGSSMSVMTSNLQSMDPLHTAYLDWRLVMRNFIAPCVPLLPTLSADQLLQLQQVMQQADSNADGLLTQPELQSVDMQPLFLAATSAPQAETGTSSADGSGPDAEGQQTAGDATTAAPRTSDEDGASGNDAPIDESAAQLKLLLCLMFTNSSAVIDVEEVMLYLCCDADGAEGLQKAFAVLTGSPVDGQVGVVADM